MDRRLQKISADIKSSSYSQVHQSLLDLRTLLQTHRPTTVAEKLRRCGITKILLRFLHKKHDKLIFLSLSILGTCCFELETREMLKTLNLPHLLKTLQAAFSSDNNIQSRICRCIGNLAALPAAASDFHDCGFVPVLVNMIKPSDTNTCSSETKQMAIRALRVLGDTGEHRQTLLLEDAVKVIADQLNSDDEDIVKASLKTLIGFCSSLEGAVQVQRGVNGTGYEQLVILARNGPKPELALQCLCSLAHVASSRPDLGKAGAIGVIFEELKKTNYKSEPRTLITALCLFCSEIVNRVRIRDNNHLPDLLELYKSSRYAYLNDIILMGLTKYLYDDMSLKIMLEQSLISILMIKLRQHVLNLYPVTHDNNTFIEAPDFSRRFSVDSECENDKSPSWRFNLGSPESSPRQSPKSPAVGPSSPSGSSLCMSPTQSPQPNTSACWSPAYSSCSGQTDTYSPVYEDSSEDDECRDILEQDSDISKLDIHKEEEERHSYMMNYFILLSRIVDCDVGITNDLMAASTVNTLLAYLVIGRIYVSRVTIILSRIMKRTQFLLPMVQQRFAILVFTKLSLRKHETACNTCSVHEKLGNCLLEKAAQVAEGPYGAGELAYILQKGSETEIHNAVLSIPFIVRTCWLLKKLLVTHGGLPIIFNLIEDNEENSNAILALSCLAKNLQISYNKPESFNDSLFPDYNQPTTEMDPTNKVTFLLDDGSQVDANKSALCAASEVFNSMLHGQFRESKENVVRLKDISKGTLILLLIYCSSYSNNSQLIVGIPEIVSVLDLFLVSDKFLITELNSVLLSYIKFNYFNVDNFVKLYKWCNDRVDLQINEVISLYEDACAFLLVGPMKHKKRIQIFKNLMESGMWERMKSTISINFTQRMDERKLYLTMFATSSGKNNSFPV